LPDGNAEKDVCDLSNTSIVRPRGTADVAMIVISG